MKIFSTLYPLSIIYLSIFYLFIFFIFYSPGYVDRKYLYISQGLNASLSFLIRTTRRGPVWLCECQKGFLKYPATMGDLDVAANVFVKSLPANQAMNPVTLTAPPPHDRGRSLIVRQIADQCYRTSPVEEGTHILTLQQKSTVSINIAYILFW